MRKYNFILSICVSILLSGCASGPKFSGLEEPQPDESIIYYLREPSIAGATVFYTIYENGEPVTRLYNGGYYPHHTNPGEKHIEATTEASDELSLTAKKGERYFVKGGLSLGLVVGHPILKVIDENSALKYLQDCKLLEKSE